LRGCAARIAVQSFWWRFPGRQRCCCPDQKRALLPGMRLAEEVFAPVGRTRDSASTTRCRLGQRMKKACSGWSRYFALSVFAGANDQGFCCCARSHRCAMADLHILSKFGLTLILRNANLPGIEGKRRLEGWPCCWKWRWARINSAQMACCGGGCLSFFAPWHKSKLLSAGRQPPVGRINPGDDILKNKVRNLPVNRLACFIFHKKYLQVSSSFVNCSRND